MATQLYVPTLSATDHADRLESREQREDFATLLAEKIVAAQRGAAAADIAAAVAPIRRSEFEKLPPAAAMSLVLSGRKIID